MVAAAAQMHPREAVQRFTEAIFEATGGVLNDDATAMCLGWHGGPMRSRTTNSGSDRRRYAPQLTPAAWRSSAARTA